MRYKTSIYTCAAILAALLLLCGISCNEEPPYAPEEPIFSDVTKIEIGPPAHTATIVQPGKQLCYELPSDVRYAVVELFNGSIDVNEDDNTVSMTNLVGGTRTGLGGFTRSYAEVTLLRTAESDGSDFTDVTIESTIAGNQTYNWFVLGYDDQGMLTHASPAWEVTITWE